MLDGRVKTLHPKIHGGLLARRDDAAHTAALNKAGIVPIDLLAVNLYPFQATVADPTAASTTRSRTSTSRTAMLRAAARTIQGSSCWSIRGLHEDPGPAEKGGVSDGHAIRARPQGVRHTAAYDGAVANYLSSLRTRSAASIRTC